MHSSRGIRCVELFAWIFRTTSVCKHPACVYVSGSLPFNPSACLAKPSREVAGLKTLQLSIQTLRQRWCTSHPHREKYCSMNQSSVINELQNRHKSIGKQILGVLHFVGLTFVLTHFSLITKFSGWLSFPKHCISGGKKEIGWNADVI